MSGNGRHRHAAIGLAGAVLALAVAGEAAAAGQERQRPTASSPARTSSGVALSADAAASRPPLEPGVPVDVRIGRGQSAFFRIPARADSSWSVRTRGLAGDTDTVLELLAPDGRSLVSNDDGNGEGDLASRIDFDSGDGGAVVRAGTLEDQGGRFQVVLTRTGPSVPVDFPTTLDQARARAPLAAGQRTELRLPPGRAAVFALPPDRDLVVERADLKGSTDTVLELLDASGAMLAESDDVGQDLSSRIRTRAHRGKAAFVRVRELEGKAGGFALVVREAPQRNAPGVLATPPREAADRPALAPGQAVRLTLQEGEEAFFALPDDGAAYVAMTYELGDGASVGDGPDTVLALVGPDGKVVDENDDTEGLASRLAVPAGRPAFLRASLLEGTEGAFSLVLVRAPR